MINTTQFLYKLSHWCLSYIIYICVPKSLSANTVQKSSSLCLQVHYHIWPSTSTMLTSLHFYWNTHVLFLVQYWGSFKACCFEVIFTSWLCSPEEHAWVVGLVHRRFNSGPVFCLLLGVSSGCARPITGQLPVLWLAEHSLSLLRARDRKRA